MNLRLANEPDMIEDDVELEIDLEEPYTIFDVSKEKNMRDSNSEW